MTFTDEPRRAFRASGNRSFGSPHKHHRYPGSAGWCAGERPAPCFLPVPPRRRRKRSRSPHGRHLRKRPLDAGIRRVPATASPRRARGAGRTGPLSPGRTGQGGCSSRDRTGRTGSRGAGTSGGGGAGRVGKERGAGAAGRWAPSRRSRHSPRSGRIPRSEAGAPARPGAGPRRSRTLPGAPRGSRRYDVEAASRARQAVLRSRGRRSRGGRDPRTTLSGWRRGDRIPLVPNGGGGPT